MKIDMTDLLNSITENLKRIDYIKPEEIPNIDLYMDQVTTFMDEHLAGTKRRDEDKILTKTMINNYSNIFQTRRRLASPNCIPKFASLKNPVSSRFPNPFKKHTKVHSLLFQI